MTIVGAALCMCQCVYLCVCEVAKAGWHGRGASHFLLGCSCKPFLPLSFLSFPLLPFTPRFSIPFDSWPYLFLYHAYSLPCFSTPSLPFCLPLLLPLSLSYYTIPPSLCLYAQGKGLSLYRRVEPLSCSHFIHMETQASLLVTISLARHTWNPIFYLLLYVLRVLPVDGADTGDAVVVAHSLSQEPVPDLPGKHGRVLAFVIGNFVNHFGCSNLWFGSPNHSGADTACLIVPVEGIKRLLVWE